MRLSGKIIVVTGGAGLLGQSFVRAICREGGIAVLADINAESGARVARTIGQEVGDDKVVFEKLDITSKESVTQLIKKLHDRFGKIDGLVNNAYPRAANYGRKFEDVEFEDFCRSVDLHVGGYFLAAQQFALYFRKQKYGNIISLASIYGVMAPRFQVYSGTTMTMPVEYAVIKSAVIHLNRYMMRYFQGSAIRFNCISPGGILDGQADAFVAQYRAYAQTKGMLAPSDVTGALIFLLSDDSIFVNGQNLIVDDGFSV